MKVPLQNASRDESSDLATHLKPEKQPS